MYGYATKKIVDAVNWEKTIKIVSVITVVIILAIVLYFFVYKKFIKKGIEKLNLNENLDDLLDELPQEQQTTTLTEAKALSIANDMYAILEGITGGYNMSGFSALVKQIQTTADWLLVQKKFGIRDGETLKEWLVGDNFDDDVQDYFITLDITY